MSAKQHFIGNKFVSILKKKFQKTLHDMEWRANCCSKLIYAQ